MRARATASDLFEAGWLPPRAAAARMGIDVGELLRRAHRGEVRRRSLAHGIYVYEVDDYAPRDDA